MKEKKMDVWLREVDLRIERYDEEPSETSARPENLKELEGVMKETIERYLKKQYESEVEGKGKLKVEFDFALNLL